MGIVTCVLGHMYWACSACVTVDSAIRYSDISPLDRDFHQNSNY